MTEAPWGARGRGTGHTLRVVGLVLAALALSGAVVVVLLPLPKPAIGGGATCGPGRGSESAIEAFFDPVTIGAGTEPPTSATTQNLSWQAFVGECQAATNGRMVDALALVILAGFFLLVVPRAVRVAWPESRRKPLAAGAGGAAPPGWYQDPADSSGWRWWDGFGWGHHTVPGSSPGTTTTTDGGQDQAWAMAHAPEQGPPYPGASAEPADARPAEEQSSGPEPPASSP